MAISLFAVTTTLFAAAPAADHTSTEPYLRLRDATLGYNGSAEDFANLTEIRVGWFGPSDAADPLHGDFWWAANLAVEEANQHPPTTDQAAFTGLPIRLVPRWSVDPWGTGVSQLTRMVYDEQPLALLGSVDSAATHLAEQVVAKANLPLVSPIATDPSVTLAGVSWMFSCAPDDTAIARALVDAVLESPEPRSVVGAALGRDSAGDDGGAAPVAAAGKAQGAATDTSGAKIGNQKSQILNSKLPIVLLSTTDHESRMTTREVMREFRRRDHLPAFRFEVTPKATDMSAQLRVMVAAKPAALVVIAGPEDAARLVRAVRAELDSVPIYGGPALGRSCFANLAGPAAEGVRFPLLFDPGATDDAAVRFTARFTAERHHAPDYTAALAYDATRLLIEAIRRAGPNRARVREALKQLSPWRGIAGPIAFDGTGQNQRAAVAIGTIQNGAVMPLSASASPVPRAANQFNHR